MAEEIINKVASSALQQLDLEDFYPKEQIVLFDLKPYLFMELILKEKDFREALQQQDWSAFAGKIVGITCSTDAIIPVWAYMLVATYLQPVAAGVYFGDEKEALKQVFLEKIANLDASAYTEKRVVIKGCGEVQIDAYAYVAITAKLRPFAKSMMYGEPCSTVPIYKKK